MAFSPDGSLLATGPRAAGTASPGPDGRLHPNDVPDPLRVWRAADGTMLASFGRGLRDMAPIRQLCWTADGRRVVATGDDGMLRAWDPHEPPETALTAPTGDPGSTVACSPTENRVAVNGGERVLLFEVEH